MAPPAQGRRGLVRGTTLFPERPRVLLPGSYQANHLGRQALLALTGCFRSGLSA